MRLPVLLAAWFMAQFDFFVVNVAAPTFVRELGAGPVALELIVGGYAFTYAAGMVTAGRLGDRYGHRRLFVIGVAAFTVTSLACGLAAGPGQLVAARLAQGLAGALMVPQVLGTITATYPPERRGRAIGWYGVTGGLGSIAGQVLGGLLLVSDVFGLGWRVVFLINVPVGLLTLALARRLPESRVSRARGLDPLGAVGIAGTLALALVPLTLGRTLGWPAWTVVALCLSPLAALGTVAWQRRLAARGRDPILAPTLFRTRSYVLGILSVLLFMAYFAAFMFTLALLLQDGHGLSAFQAGCAFAPMGVSFGVTALLGARWTTRYGLRVVGIGCATVAAGLLVLAGTNRLAVVIVAITLVGAGNGLILPQLIGAALRGVPPESAGTASAVVSTAQQFAGAAGVTLLGTLFFAVLPGHGTAAAMRATVVVDLVLIAAVAGLVGLLARTGRAPARR
ncbi:MFS transporter [Actinocatenispora rupis]|uniref:MFS transporter n=1 Tax=Actinocatenispora rupis TaxID=519421 RepID=A0A8J3JAF9_9ACTN|nr:MFS transporter [Actinocatenispora rupis]GID14792.1 MFS transporter [Actinocatenispora rupis]